MRLVFRRTPVQMNRSLEDDNKERWLLDYLALCRVRLALVIYVLDALYLYAYSQCDRADSAPIPLVGAPGRKWIRLVEEHRSKIGATLLCTTLEPADRPQPIS